jgi:O-antigen/teichoic acid export membrane protein
MYAVAAGADASVSFGRAFTRILAAYVFVGLGLCLFAPEVVHLLGGEAYAAAVPIVAPVVLACLFQAAATLMDAAFFVRRRTGIKLWVTLPATAAMLLFYAWLIPIWGAMGAALATLGGFVILALATYLTTQRIFFVRYEWTRLLATTVLAAGFWLVGTHLPAGAWGIVGKAALLLAAPGTAWVAGLVSTEEKQDLRDLLRLFAAQVRLWRGVPEGSAA